MTLSSFNYSPEDLAAAELETANPYLANPAKGLQLIARLIAHPPHRQAQEQQRHLAPLQRLIHEDFVALAVRSEYPAQTQAYRQLLALEKSLQDLVHFPHLANKTIVGVGGGFSAGKSRFLNTLLGEALLPEDTKPTTAIPSFLTGGQDSIVALNTFNHAVEIDAEALEAISHKFSNHYQQSLGETVGFAHILKLLMIHRQAFTWNNLAFLDTPGYSKADAQEANQTDEKIALKQLGQADQLVWLLSARNGSLRQDDLAFLRKLNHPKPIFFVLTQAEFVGSDGIHDILQSTAQAIEESGLSCAGLMAWAAPLCDTTGTMLAGDDIRVWLGQLDLTPKYTTKQGDCVQVLDEFIQHNQDCLASNRQNLKLLNALLPLADQLPTQQELQGLRKLIQTKRSEQKNLGELAHGFETLKSEMLVSIEKIADALAIDDRRTAEADAQTQYQLGVCYAEGDGVDQDDALAVRCYRKAAELGHTGAQFNLGVCYDNGTGVEKDEALAVSWYREAAEQGHARAQVNLGVCYHYGTGVRKDEAAAVSWYRKAVELGHAQAQFNLGVCYKLGTGVEKDESAAVSWYRKAAKQGHAVAQFNLGVCYHYGTGVEKDEALAVSWYRKAAEQDHANAQFNLAVCYANGSGVKKDTAVAHSWFNKAAAQGHVKAKSRI